MTWHNRADGAPGPPSRWLADSLGESLVLVGDLENRQAELEERFPPPANPRAGTTDRAATCRDRRHCPPCRDSRRRTLEEPARPAVAHLRLARAVLLEGRRPPGRIPHPRRPQSTHGPRMAPRSHRRPSAGSARQPSPAPRYSPQPYHRARPATPARRPALIQTPVPHLTCPVAFPSATEQTRPDSSQASGRSFCRRCSVTEPPRIDRVQDQA
jgi:hypothetical protein